MLVRRARAADADPVAECERLLFGADAWTPAQVAAELSHDLRHGWVADHDGRLVGYAVLLVVGDTVDLQRVAVLPGHRRRGVARELLAAALGGLGPGVTRLLLEVRADNASARAFYGSLGYAEIAVRSRYYADGTDAVVLQAQLSLAPERPLGRPSGRPPDGPPGR